MLWPPLEGVASVVPEPRGEDSVAEPPVSGSSSGMWTLSLGRLAPETLGALSMRERGLISGMEEEEEEAWWFGLWTGG